jgi:hypothetical protein
MVIGRPAMRRAAYVGFCFLLAVAGCAHQAPIEIADISALATCPEPSAQNIGISASVLPVQIPAELRAPGSNADVFARRVVVTFARGSLQPGTSLLWTRLSLRTLGGQVAGWTRLQSDGVLIDLASPGGTRKRRMRSTNDELAAVEPGAGYITIERTSRTQRGVTSALSLDVLVSPGGVRIDEPVMRIPQLWSKDGTPLSPDALQIDLVPLRHAPGYDTLEADVVLEFVAVSRRSGTGAGTGAGVGAGADTATPCVSSAQTRAILVTRDAVRPALWDLGTSSQNAPRARWLALSSPEVGVVRAVFESPEAATSFANWVRATQSLSVGAYRLGLFQRAGRTPLRPLVPVDLSSTETFRPLTAEDARALRVGPLGEP